MLDAVFDTRVSQIPAFIVKPSLQEVVPSPFTEFLVLFIDSVSPHRDWLVVAGLRMPYELQPELRVQLQNHQEVIPHPLFGFSDCFFTFFRCGVGLCELTSRRRDWPVSDSLRWNLKAPSFGT